jgi:hypothetical protein
MSKIIKAVSPKGKASWPKLFKADTQFKPEGEFQTGLVVSPTEAKDFQEKIKAAFVEEFGEAKLQKAKMPWKVDEDGNVVFNFRSKNKPIVVDSLGKAIGTELNVSGGSVIKVGAGIKPWLVSGNLGVKLYLNAVQIIDLVEYNNSPFGKEEGGFVAEDVKRSEEVSSAVEQAEEDTIDF